MAPDAHEYHPVSANAAAVPKFDCEPQRKPAQRERQEGATDVPRESARGIERDLDIRRGDARGWGDARDGADGAAAGADNHLSLLGPVAGPAKHASDCGDREKDQVLTHRLIRRQPQAPVN